MSVGAAGAIRSAPFVFARTAEHPAVRQLAAENISLETFDYIYDSSETFEDVYSRIADRILEESKTHGDVVYAVPGHPLAGEASVAILLQRARDQGIPCRILGSESFIEASLEALGVGFGTGIKIVDALSMDAVEVASDVPNLIYQIFDRSIASEVKLKLMQRCPDDFQVSMVLRAGTEDQEVRTIPLHELDRSDVDHLTTVYVPSSPDGHLRRAGEAFDDLVETMAVLRAENGCPWDRQQTHESLKKYLLEETYETLEAVDSGDMEELCAELGDLMLQAVFHAQLADERGDFDVKDSIEHITVKLHRRHPHVFGDATVASAEEVLHRWAEIKAGEKGFEDRVSVLDGVPKTMPALARALEISKRAAGEGFEWPDLKAVFDKLEEEVGELREELLSGNETRIAEEIGDLLFTVVNVARWTNVEPEDALRVMMERFTSRFKRIEQEAGAAGRSLADMTIEEMDQVWDRAKQEK